MQWGARRQGGREEFAPLSLSLSLSHSVQSRKAAIDWRRTQCLSDVATPLERESRVTKCLASVLIVGLSYGARNVLPYTCTGGMMQNFMAFRESPIIPLECSPVIDSYFEQGAQKRSISKMYPMVTPSALTAAATAATGVQKPTNRRNLIQRSSELPVIRILMFLKLEMHE